MDIVLGVSMAPASVQMVLLEGANADGVTVEEDEFDVSAAADSATASASDRVLAAILGTCEGAADAGLEMSAIGVTWTDQLEAVALRDALTAHKLENVMLVSAFLAATALAQNVGGAMGYERTAMLFVELEAATLAVVETSDGSIVDLYKEEIYAETYDDATAQLTGLIAGLEELDSAPGGLLVLGTGVDIALIKPALQSATSLTVSAPEEPQTALARGAALAAANAPLFASSTAALAYAQDPGTGAVDASAAPSPLSFDPLPYGGEFGDDDLAYSAVADEDADTPTVFLQRPVGLEREPRRRPVLLVSSGLAVVGISAVVALEIAMAIGIRNTTIALQPTPSQQLIVPAQQAAPAPVQASAPMQKISAPAPMVAPKALNPPAAIPHPAAPVPAAPVVPVPVVVPPVVAPVVPPLHAPSPNWLLSPQLMMPHLSPPQPLMPQSPVHVPQPQSPAQGTGTGPQSPPPHRGSSGQGSPPKQGGPGGPGGHGGGEPAAPGPFAGGHGGEPAAPGPFGGGHGGGGGEPAAPGPFGGEPGAPGPFGGPHGGGFGGGGEPAAPGPFGGGREPAAPGPFGGGLGGEPAAPGPFGGGHGGGGFGGFGGGHGGGFGGFGGGHGGGGFGGGHR